MQTPDKKRVAGNLVLKKSQHPNTEKKTPSVVCQAIAEEL